MLWPAVKDVGSEHEAAAHVALICSQELHRHAQTSAHPHEMSAPCQQPMLQTPSADLEIVEHGQSLS